MSEQDAADAETDEAPAEDDADEESQQAQEPVEEADDSAGETDQSADDSAGDNDQTVEDLDDIAEAPDEDDATLSDIAEEAEEDLVERIDDADPEDVAEELRNLRERVEDLEAELEEREAEVEDLESRLKRKQADFQNYKKRQKEKLEEVRERATEDLVERLLDVRDSLQRALDTDEDADIRSGVESTLNQFDQQLERENAEFIDPDPGEETDPTRHEVLMRVNSDQPEGTVDEVHRIGCEMAGTVIRPAQVTVSDGPGDENES